MGRLGRGRNVKIVVIVYVRDDDIWNWENTLGLGKFLDYKKYFKNIFY